MAYAPSLGTIGNLNDEAYAQAPTTNLQFVGDALESAKSLSKRVEILASRLCGEVPTEVSRGKEGVPQVGGIFTALGVVSSDTSRCIRDAHAALDRIERELPH